MATNGKPVEAINAAGDAVRIFRELHERVPDAFDGYLAEALMQLARPQFAAGNVTEARRLNDEALALYRQLSSDRSKAWERDMAQGLIDFAKFRATGPPDVIQDSVRALQESLRILHQLNASVPLVVATDIEGAKRLRAKLGGPLRG